MGRGSLEDYCSDKPANDDPENEADKRGKRDGMHGGRLSDKRDAGQRGKEVAGAPRGLGSKRRS